MGVALGLLFGIGLALCWWALVFPRTAPSPSKKIGYFARLLREAGYFHAPAGLGVVVCLVAGVVVGGVVFSLTRTPLIALIVAGMAALLPIIVLRGQAEARIRKTSRLWPDVIDDIVAGIRAGVPLPEILMRLGTTGPELLRPDFAAFTSDFQATGDFSDALNQLKMRFAHRDADRLIEVLRLSREVGGADLSTLLRDLALMMRMDLRTRGELESRQSWTINAARLAVVSPWIVLLLITSRTGGVNAFASAQGSLVLLSGLLISILAYYLMIRSSKLSLQRVTR